MSRFKTHTYAGIALLCLTLSGLAGCGMTPKSAHTNVVRDVIRMHGGLSEVPAEQHHIQMLLDDLRPHLTASAMPAPRVRVLATGRPVAYAVAPRDIFVSRGLLVIASDQELRACLGHELGHLDEVSGKGVSSLVGETGLTCPEARADRFAVELLARADMQPEAMGSLLACMIEHPSTGDALKQDLGVRLSLLDSTNVSGAMPVSD